MAISSKYVDKNISELLELTDYNLILEKGALVWHGRTDDLEKSSEIISIERGTRE